MKAGKSFVSSRSTRFLSILSTLSIFAAISARGEFVASVFSAKTIDEDSDVRVKQAGGTDLKFHDARFEGKDFESPQYYGMRLAYFLHEDKPGFGFGLEFFHAKVYMKTGDILHVNGTRGGVPVNDNEPANNTIQSFNNSHGLNFLTADAFYRWVFDDSHKVLSRFRPYLGAGMGVAIPHVEATVGSSNQNEYQLAGPGVQAMAGLDFKVSRHFSLFTEYKFTYADLSEDIPGGSIHFEPMIHHFVGGVSLHFW